MASLTTTAVGPAEAPAPRSASALWLAGLAALLASSCCVLPLVFVLVGVSGAWIAQLTLLQPYSLWLEALAVAALAIAGWRIYRPRLRSEPGAVSCPATRPAARAWFWIIAVLTLLPIVVSLLAPLFY